MPRPKSPLDHQDSLGTAGHHDVVRDALRVEHAWQRVQQAATELKNAQRDATAAELDLMETMDEAGLKTFAMPNNGPKVTIGVAVRGGVGQERKDEAHRWLEEHGHGDLIKRHFTVSFGREEQNQAQWFRDEIITANELQSVERTEVHHSTLAAWLRRMFTANTLPPLETFGVFVDRRPIFTYQRKKNDGTQED